MSYQDEWILLEAQDEIDEVEHRQPTEEFLFYQAVTNGDLDAVRENCEQERFLDSEGVGVLSRNPVTNLKYHFVITTAMVTRLCKQKGMELEQAFRMSDFYIQKLDDIHTVQGGAESARLDGSGLCGKDAEDQPERYQFPAYQCLQGVHLFPYQGTDHDRRPGGCPGGLFQLPLPAV